MKHVIKAVCLAGAVFLLWIPLQAWEVLKTEKFRVFYPEGYETRAEHLLYCLEKYSHIPEGITGNYRSDVTVVLEDAGNYINAYANPAFGRVAVFNREYLNEDWLALAGVHEHTHFLHMTKAGGIPGILSFFIGNIMAPNILSPMWIHEAIAVYCESAVSPYMGRLNDGTFLPYIAASAAAGKMPSILKATYRPVEPPLYLGPYIYGSAFFKYLADTRGEDKFKIFYEDFGSNILSYAGGFLPGLSFDPAMKKAFGLATENLWNEWVSYETKKHAGYKLIGEQITDRGWSHGTPAAFNGKVYFSRARPEKPGAYDIIYMAELVEYCPAEKQETVIAKSTSGFIHPPKNGGGKIFYSVGDRGGGFHNRSMRSFGNISVIYALENGKSREVLRGNIRDYFVEGNNIYGCYDDARGFGSAVYVYDIERKASAQVVKTDYLITELSRYDGDFLITYKEKGGSQNIAVLDVETREKRIIAATPWQESYAFADGARVFFTSNRGGLFSAYCADAETGRTYRLSDGGHAEAAVYEKESGLIFFRGINENGYDIYSLKPEFGIIEPQKIYEPPPAPVIKNSNTEAVGGSYLDNIVSLYPKIRMPVVYSTHSGSVDAGMFFAGQDAIGDFSYQAGMYYGLQAERIKFDGFINMLFLSPLFLYAAGDNYNVDGIWLGLELPLLDSSQMGFNQVSAGLSAAGYNRDSSYSRLYGWAPYAVFGVSFDRTFWKLNLKALNRYYYNSSYTQTRHYFSGVSGELSFKQYFGEVSVRVSCSYTEDKGHFDALPAAEAYEREIYSDRGWYSQAEISAKIFEVRGGLWNPINFYVEDVFLKLFGESVSHGYLRQMSGGLELTAEVKTFFIADMEAGVRSSFNIEGGHKTMFVLRSPLVSFAAKKGADIWGEPKQAVKERMK